MEDTAQAQTYFKKLYEVEPRAAVRIPDSYLKDIDKKAYDKRMKEQKQAREEREKALREKNKKESKIKS
jgi:hypothetical protein